MIAYWSTTGDVHARPDAPVDGGAPDAYRKLIDLTLWQRAADRNDVFDTNLIPEVVATPLSHCGVVWIITQADDVDARHEQGSALPPGPLFGPTPAFAVPHDWASGSSSAGSSTWFRCSKRSGNATRCGGSRRASAGKVPAAGSPAPTPPTASVNIGDIQ